MQISSLELQIYVKHFGESKNDWELVAEVGGKIVGAVWVRIMNDYGHIDDETPSLATSLYMEMAKILNVNYIHLIGVTPGCVEDIMLTSLGLDKDDHSTIHLFQLVRNPGKCNASYDKSVRYYANDNWSAHAPVGMCLEYGLVNDFMREWRLRKEQLKNGEISEDEYFE